MSTCTQEVPFFCTWLNWLYFSPACVSAITAALLDHKSQFKPVHGILFYSDFPPSQSYWFIVFQTSSQTIDQTFQPAVDHRDSFFTPWTLSIPHKWPLITPVLLTHTSMSVTVSKARGNPRIPVSQLPSGFILIQCLYPSVRHGAAFPISSLLFISFFSSSVRLRHWNIIDKKEIWHLNVTRVQILQMCRFYSPWLVATLLTSTSRLLLERRHLPVGDGGEGWGDIRLSFVEPRLRNHVLMLLMRW